MSETIIFRAPEPGRRRRFTVEQKRTLLEAAKVPGASISSVARQHGLHASMLFQWRHAMENGEEKGLESGEDVVPASKVNHKRTYLIMRKEKRLLQRYRPRPDRPHDGKIITLKSDLKWCTDAFEIRCWNGERVPTRPSRMTWQRRL